MSSFSESDYTSVQLPDANSNNSFVVETDVSPKTYKMISAFFAVFLLGALTALASLVGFYSLTENSNGSNIVIQKCSNKGIYEPDTLICECFPCYTGSNCEILVANDSCVVDASLGQPYLFEEFWMNYTRDRDASGQGYVTDVTYRVPYDMGGPLTPDGSNLTKFDQLLNQAIRSVHSKWNNAQTTNYSIVYGYGATQITAAAIFAIASKKNRSLNVFEQTPYYPLHSALLVPDNDTSFFTSPYPISAQILNPAIATWSNSKTLNPDTVLEVITAPANPSGVIRQPFYSSPASSRIYDLAYYWPHLTANTSITFAEDVMVFSLSKLTGHASTRFGWALVKDKNVATCMWDYILRQNLWVSSTTRRRAIVLLNTMANDGDYFVSTVSGIMRNRWDRILDLMNGAQNRFSLAGEPYTAYLYLHMTNPDERSSDAANALFKSVGILGQSGETFGDNNGTFRINLTLHSHMFEYLLQRLKGLMYSDRPWSSSSLFDFKKMNEEF